MAASAGHGPALAAEPPGPPRLPACDPYAADRFTVDLDEWGGPEDGATSEPVEPTVEPLVSPWRLLGRLALVLTLTCVAFHHSLASLFRTVASGSVLVYVLAVPLLAGLAAAARDRRSGSRRGADVRPADVVAGALLCGLAVGLTSLVGPGLSGVYFVWRLDLLMLWVFLLGANLLTFGARQIRRWWAFWCVLLLVWPFPMRLVNVAAGSALGGSVGLVLVVLAVLAYGNRPREVAGWRVVGSAALAGLVLLGLCGVTSNPQRLLWPPVAAALVGAAWWAGRSGSISVAPVADRRVRGGVAALVGLSTLGLLVLPAAPRPVPPSVPTGITGLSVGAIEVPGWVRTGSRALDQRRYFGSSSSWERVTLQQGGALTGPTAGGRTLVMDVVSTPRPQTLELYPVVATYPMGTLAAAPDAVVDLGHGVQGGVYRAEDTRRRLSYTLLTFAWTLPVDMSIVGPYTGPPAQLTQRVTLLAVDDRRPGAPFPDPGNASLDGVRAAFADVWSGRQASPARPLEADERLLDDTGRRLVEQRLTGG